MDCFELLSDLAIKWDRSVYEPSHMVFAPHEGAKYESFEGTVVDVDTLLASDNTPVIERVDLPKPDNDDLTRLVDLQNINDQTFEDLRSALWYPKMLNQAENYPSWVDMGNRLAWFKDTHFEDEAKRCGLIGLLPSIKETYPLPKPNGLNYVLKEQAIKRYSV